MCACVFVCVCVDIQYADMNRNRLEIFRHMPYAWSKYDGFSGRSVTFAITRHVNEKMGSVSEIMAIIVDPNMSNCDSNV